MNKHKLKASKAFSLIELSIVILIVGIIVAGITQSSRLVRQSKVKSAQSLTQSSPVSSIKGVSLWLETSQDESFPSALDDNSALPRWNDINPQASAKLYAIPASGSGDANRIAYDFVGINGLPSIEFKAIGTTTADVLAVSTGTTLSHTPIITNNDANAANAFTAFVVYRLADGAVTTSAYTALYNGSSTNGWGYQRATTTAGRAALLNGSAVATTTNVLPTTPEIATIVYSGRSAAGAGTGITNVYINGGSGFTSTTGNNAVAGSATTVTQPTLNMYIGGSTGATAGAAPTAVWRGLISEVIIFDTALKTQDLKDVVNYLSRKYGIAVS